MNFWKKLAQFLAPSAYNEDERTFFLKVKCKRCGEVLESRINLYNDLSVEYDDRGLPESYFCRKIVMGQNHCYQQIEVGLKFNAKRQLVDKTISGGAFVETEAGSKE